MQLSHVIFLLQKNPRALCEVLDKDQCIHKLVSTAQVEAVKWDMAKITQLLKKGRKESF